MPTGYTAGVQDGTITDFRTFALQCARAFGATILQRDEAISVPPAEREVSEYYHRRVEEAKARATTLADMTPREAAAACEADHQLALTAWDDSEQRRTVGRERYTAMLEQVKAWSTPTKEHAGLKAFMVEQLEESIRFDTSGTLWGRPKTLASIVWLRQQREHAADELIRAKKALQEEEDRCAQASQWVRDLYASLEPSHAG